MNLVGKLFIQRKVKNNKSKCNNYKQIAYYIIILILIFFISFHIIPILFAFCIKVSRSFIYVFLFFLMIFLQLGNILFHLKNIQKFTIYKYIQILFYLLKSASSNLPVTPAL